MKPLISLFRNQRNEINGLWEHHKMKKGLVNMKKLFNNSYPESDSMECDEYWETLFQDEKNHPEKANCEGECDVGQIFGPRPISAIELLSQARNGIVSAGKVAETLPYEHWQMLSHSLALLSKVQEYLYNR